MFNRIAFEDGSLGTIWGPCTGDGGEPCECPSCQNAERLFADGKDWDEEYEKARGRNFDRDQPAPGDE